VAIDQAERYDYRDAECILRAGRRASGRYSRRGSGPCNRWCSQADPIPVLPDAVGASGTAGSLPVARRTWCPCGG